MKFKFAILGLLVSIAIPAMADTVRPLNFRKLVGRIEPEPFVTGRKAEALFKSLSGTRYILYTPGMSTFVSTSVKFGSGLACLSTFDEQTLYFRCHRLVAFPELP